MNNEFEHAGENTENREERDIYMEKTNKNNYADVVEENLKNIDFEFIRKNRIINDEQEEAIFILPMSVENTSALNVKLLIDDKGDSKFRCYIAENVSDKKRMAVIAECNRLNSKYRYIKLSLDKDGDVCAAYDFAIFGEEEEIGAHAISMLFLCTDIVDKCIPYIMKKIWSEETVNSLQEEEGGDL